MKNNNKLWFRARRFGWGWRPVSWQGWIITIIYVVGLVNFAMDADKTSHSVSDSLLGFAGPFILLTLCFLAICYLMGERPHWHWGK